MTSPGPDSFTQRLASAGSAVGAARPQLALTLANSDLSDTEMHAVGGFVTAMNLATTHQLSLDSGATTNFTNDELDYLSGVKEDVAQTKSKPQADSRSWLQKAADGLKEAVSNTGNWLVHNPVTGAVLDVGKFLGDVVHYPFRLLSSGLDPNNDDEIDREMRADGYDPESTASYLAFMWKQGNNAYHDLSQVREQYGDPLVDKVIQAQRDPEQFQKDYQNASPEEAKKLAELTNSPEWDAASKAVGARSISPGRDLARILTLGHVDNAGFRVASGVLDAAYDWFTDPTLILGKGFAAARAIDVVTGDLAKGSRFAPSNIVARGIDKLRGQNQRAGLRSGDLLVDQAGVEKLLRTVDGKAVTAVGKGWERFLSDAADLRNADKIEQAGIYRAMQNRYGRTLMPLLDEVNGTKVLAEGEAADGIDTLITGTPMGGLPAMRTGQPITKLDDLAKYLTSKNGLLRLTTGSAARREIMVPGRLSLWATHRAARDTITAKRVTNQAEKWLDYTKSKLVPDATEAPLYDLQAAAVGDAQHSVIARSALGQLLRGDVGASIRTAKAKADRLSRRITTLMPNVTHLDLYGANSGRQLEQVARLYLNKGDSARLAAAYQLGDLGTRRQIAKGVLEQMFHASGLSKSEDGLNWAKKYLGDLDEFDRQQYGLGGESLINVGGTLKEGALYQDQLSTKVLLPDFRNMQFLAAKYAMSGFARRTGLANVYQFGQSPFADHLMAAVKVGWIATVAGGLRNALDEIANFSVNRMGREVIAGRVAFSKATRELRDQRRGYTRQYLADLKASGGDRAAFNERLAENMGQAHTSFEDAQRGLEAAQRGELELSNAELIHPTKLAAHQDRVTTANDAVVTAQAKVKALSNSGDDAITGAESAADELRAALAERAAAEKALETFRSKPAPKPGEATEQVRQKLADKGIPSVVEAQAQIARAEAELRRTQGLELAIKHRIPQGLRWVADNVNDLLITPLLGHALSVFGKGYKVTPEHVKYAQELINNQLTQVLHEGVFQSHFADDAMRLGSDAYAMELHRAGLRARRYSYSKKFDGWGEVETDGGTGLDAWAKTLGLRFANQSSVAHAWIDTIARMVPPGTAIDDAALESAKLAVRAELEKPELRHFIDQAEVFKRLKDGRAVEDDPVLQALAKDEYADRVSGDLVRAVAHKSDNGPVIHPGLLKQLRAAKEDSTLVPDRSWLAVNVPASERPEKAIGQLWAPYNGNHEPGHIASGYTQMMTKAYHKVVTDQINALARNPLMTALYFNAREATLPYRAKLVAAGFDEASADEVVQRIALAHAQDEAFKHIDNPYVGSQFSFLGRNWFAFVRAQEDWVRRWGRTLRDNPQLIREAQLLIHGGQSVGFVEQDDQGNLNFVYPGSGMMLGVFGKVAGIFGKGNPAQVPLHGELSSQLQFLNPSLDNPLGVSGTPLLSLPLKFLTGLIWHDDKVMQASLDQAVNGQMGAGRKWWETFMPSWVNRILGGVISTDPASKYGAAAAQAMANMEAAGQLDDPELQTAPGKARFMTNLATAIHNNLALTALFGFVGPAAPTLNPEAKGGQAKPGKGNAPDWSAHEAGLRTLRDEARQAVSKLGYEKALQWWQATHPGELVYMQDAARTEVNTKNASAPATLVSANWLQRNPDFLSKYGGKGGIAAYFLPQGPPGTKDGEYSDVAYRAELELGIRQYKPLDELFDDIVTSRGANEYFKAKDEYDALKADAASRGDKQAVAEIDAQWKLDKTKIMAQNPMLAAKQANYATDASTQPAALKLVTDMVRDGSPAVVKAVGRGNLSGVKALLDAWSTYQANIAQFSGSRSKEAEKARVTLRDTYDATVQALSTQFPDLADLARGVFRLP